MNKKNPYSLYFGKEPHEMISRLAECREVCDTFLSDEPSQVVYMITGVRGAGKTVFMTEVQKNIAQNEDWIIIELNPAKDMLLSLAAKLNDNKMFSEVFKGAKIDLSLFGIGITLENANPISDIETAVERMLAEIKKMGKRVLITIDEAVSSEYMRILASSFQIFIRKDLPIFLLMTGLYENIDALQNDKVLTFLYRAPKLCLKPLNIGRMAASYEKTMNIPTDKARKMAQLTMGYSFAYQVMGYYTYENNGDYIKALPSIRQQLDEYVYDKIWSEVSNKDKSVLFAITEYPDGSISHIRESLGMKPNEFGPYRNRLIKKGLVDGTERGYVRIVLPFFDDYVKDNYY